VAMRAANDNRFHHPSSSQRHRPIRQCGGVEPVVGGGRWSRVQPRRQAVVPYVGQVVRVVVVVRVVHVTVADDRWRKQNIHPGGGG